MMKVTESTIDELVNELFPNGLYPRKLARCAVEFFVDQKGARVDMDVLREFILFLKTKNYN